MEKRAIELRKDNTVYEIGLDGGVGAFSLGDWENGQVVTLKKSSEIWIATIVPSNFASGTGIVLESKGDCVTLQFLGTQWYAIGKSRRSRS